MFKKGRIKTNRCGGDKIMKVGLIGNQNSGKTTLFNYLTGMNAKIGNWPGVTIEKKTGKIKGTEHEITDLPGIYSLSPYTTEEEVSRNYVFEENPDLIINIVDATSLERSLYLTTQLLELNCKVLVALNMADILEKKGLKIDVDKLSKELGTKVVQISALKETGMDDLLKAIDEDFTTLNKEIYDSNIGLTFLISNTYKGKIDLSKIGTKGYTTKGGSHGKGLHLAKKMLNKNNNISTRTIINGNQFVQKIIIKKE